MKISPDDSAPDGAAHEPLIAVGAFSVIGAG
jgi:hypothetical protein